MFCANCGTKQNEGEKFCPNCGTKFEEPLKAEVTKVEEVSKPESSEPIESVHPQKDTTVQPPKVTSKVTMTVDKVETSEANIDVDIVLSSTEDATTKVATMNDNNIATVNKKDKSENTFPQQKDDDNGLNKLKEEADKGNKEAQMSLAIKYEFGLGVAINMDMAKKYYSMIGCNRSQPQSFLINIDNNKQSGIISDKYQIESTVVFDSEIERPKIKSKSIKEGEIIFNCLIKSEDLSDQLLELINKYNKRKDKYCPIEHLSALGHIFVKYVKRFGCYKIEGKFTELKDTSYLGFFTSRSYHKEIDDIKADFLNIYELCNSLRM
ncbi:MAG: zinc-ribbon domain-containing protein [Bacteroides sp.]|nr:zinc-ribbon domain-containing protein [Bacteroides sp.]